MELKDIKQNPAEMISAIRRIRQRIQTEKGVEKDDNSS